MLSKHRAVLSHIALALVIVEPVFRCEEVDWMCDQEGQCSELLHSATDLIAETQSRGLTVALSNECCSEFRTEPTQTVQWELLVRG